MGSLPFSLVQRVQSADVNVNLSFVIGGAAAEKISAANCRLERRRRPQIERLGRLHIVMPVKEHSGFSGSGERFAIHERVHLGADNFDMLEAGTLQTICNPGGGAFDVRFVLALRADAGNAQKLE